MGGHAEEAAAHDAEVVLVQTRREPGAIVSAQDLLERPWRHVPAAEDTSERNALREEILEALEGPLALTPRSSEDSTTRTSEQARLPSSLAWMRGRQSSIGQALGLRSST